MMKNICPCCNEYEHDTGIGCSDICQICGWEDDYLQRDEPNYKPGANKMSLNEARAIWKSGKQLYVGYPKKEYMRHVQTRKALPAIG